MQRQVYVPIDPFTRLGFVEINMLLARFLLASFVIMILAASPTPARADVWGCDYDKCVAYCTKVGGKTCSTYCGRRLQDKRRDKICK